MKSPRWVSLLRMILRGYQNPVLARLAKKGKYSREQRDELGGLREDGDGVELNIRGDRRRRLLALGLVVRANTLGRRGLDGVGHCCGCERTLTSGSEPKEIHRGVKYFADDDPSEDKGRRGSLPELALPGELTKTDMTGKMITQSQIVKGSGRSWVSLSYEKEIVWHPR